VSETPDTRGNPGLRAVFERIGTPVGETPDTPSTEALPLIGCDAAHCRDHAVRQEAADTSGLREALGSIAENPAMTVDKARDIASRALRGSTEHQEAGS
jgi:hypothetical protein